MLSKTVLRGVSSRLSYSCNFTSGPENLKFTHTRTHTYIYTYINALS